MKRILRRNQLMAGYLNFTEKNDIARKDKLKDKPVAEAGVNANANESTEKEKSTDDIESNDQDVQSTPGEAIFVNATGTIDFIVEAKLSKEYVRATNSENLNAIIANKDLSTEEKKAAVDKVAEIADISEKEIAAENLIMAKGFKDVVVTMTDGYVDVIIVSKEMDDTTRAQIEDIVKRKLEVSADKITINVIDT